MPSENIAIRFASQIQVASTARPLIIAFVSGKGGVGKTMLAVALAREISSKNRTLIIDLDFFNRGLTGLMGRRQKLHSVAKPSFLGSAAEAQDEWYAVEAGDNLFHISYPDLLPPDMQKFGTLSIDILRDSLDRFIIQAASRCNCTCVVLDCHGGPDNSSFAACLISDYSLLISEPDRITFYGTLNFLRQLRRMSGEKEVDLRLVFNKVVPAFSALFLRAFYNATLKELFNGNPLLAVYPLEVYLTKEFEKTPFLTSVYPNSWLSKKTRVLIYDLLFSRHHDNLSGFIKSTPKLIRIYRKFSLGKTTPLFNLNSIMVTIVTVLMGVILLNLIIASFYKSDINKTNNEVQHLQLLSRAASTASLSAESPAVTQFASGKIGTFELRNQLRSEKAAVEANLSNAIARNESARDLIELQQRSASKSSLLAAIADLDIGAYQPAFLETGLMTKRSELLRKGIPPGLGPFEDFYRTDYSGLQANSAVFVILQTAKEDLDPSLPVIALCGSFWMVIALLMLWVRDLDRRFTYYSRQSKYVPMVSYFFVALALWIGPALVLGLIYNALRDSHSNAQVLPLTLGFVVPVAIAVDQLSRVYADIRYKRNFVEDLMRVLFVGYLVMAPFLLKGLIN